MGGESEPRGATVVGARSSSASGPDPSTRPGGSSGPVDRAGRAIGRYVVVAEAGQGGMGVVLRAYDPKLRREVAIKRLHVASSASRSDGGLAVLLREAQAMARLSHPNVLSVYDVEEIDGRAYVVMEYVEGRTLLQWARERPRDWSEILEMFVAVARGLAAAHAVGIVHRDFKPSNVLVGSDERPRVTDFGLARTNDEPDASPGPESIESVSASDEDPPTPREHVLGTPAYMAPEQHRGGDADARADQYAWGIALWEAIFGARPFTGEIEAIAAGKRSGPPPVPAGVPGWLAEVLTRALAAQPQRRFPTMTDLLSVIERGRAGARGRRALFGVAGFLAIVATLAGLRALDERHQSSACERAGAEIAEVWNDDARTRVHAAILATGVAYAAETATRVEPWLDAAAREWQVARTEACLDGQVRGIWDQDTIARSLWCLEDRRLEIEALVDELARSNEGVVAHAIGAAAVPTAIASCRDPAALARLPTPPSEHREDVQAVRRALSRVRALDHAGRYDEGLEVARAAVDQADAIGWPPIRADARLRLANILEVKGRYDDAERLAAEAYFEAAKSGATTLAADAADAMVWLLGARLSRRTEALYWSRHAEVALAMIGDESQLRMARHLGHVATVLAGMGEYHESQAMHRRSLEIREQELGPDHPWVGQSLNNIATSLSARGELREAMALYEQALGNAERAFGSEHPDVATSINNIGSVHLALGEYDRARARFEHAHALRERALGPDHPVVAQTLTNISGAYHGTGDTAKALAALQRALAIQERRLGPEHPELGGTLVNIATILRETGAAAEARAADERALAIFERALGPDHPYLGFPLTGLAEVALAQGRPGEALALAERAATLRERASARPSELATTRFAIARALWESGGDRSRAVAIATVARDTFRDAGAGKAKELAVVQDWLDGHERP